MGKRLLEKLTASTVVKRPAELALEILSKEWIVEGEWVGNYRRGEGVISEKFESLFEESEGVWTWTIHCSPYSHDGIV